MKKVLILTHSFPDQRNPAKGIFILDELNLMKKDVSYKIALLNTFFEHVRLNKNKPVSVFDIQPISYFSLPLKFFKKNKGLFISRKLKRTINFELIDIIHAHFLIPSGLALPYLDKPTVITVHGSDWNNYKDDESWFNFLKESLISASAIMVVSDSLKKSITQRIPEITNKVFSVPHSVDPFWLELPLDSSASNDIIKVITVASIIPIKGIIILIKALQEISNNNRIELTIFAIKKNPDYSEQVSQEINKLPDNIKVIIKNESTREVIRSAYHNATFSILPSLSEGFGLSIIEANACGLPVISTNSGGPESIIDNLNGVLVEPGNIKALSKAIDEMIVSVSSKKKSIIREHIKSKFSVLKRKSHILEIYNHITT